MHKRLCAGCARAADSAEHGVAHYATRGATRRCDAQVRRTEARQDTQRSITMVCWPPRVPPAPDAVPGTVGVLEEVSVTHLARV